MKCARQGLARPGRLHEDAFWRDAAWGIDYASGERTGDGRAEVWEDFCQAAKTCELTGQRCRLTPGLKAAAACVLQAFWQRKAPAELPRCGGRRGARGRTYMGGSEGTSERHRGREEAGGTAPAAATSCLNDRARAAPLARSAVLALKKHMCIYI